MASEAQRQAIAEAHARAQARFAASLPAPAEAGMVTASEVEQLKAETCSDAIRHHAALREAHFLAIEDRRAAAAARSEAERLRAELSQQLAGAGGADEDEYDDEDSRGSLTGSDPGSVGEWSDEGEGDDEEDKGLGGHAAEASPARDAASSPPEQADDFGFGNKKKLELKLRFGWKPLYFSIDEVQNAASPTGITQVLKWQSAPNGRVEGFMRLSDVGSIAITSSPGASETRFVVSLHRDRVRRASNSGGLLRLELRDKLNPAGAEAFAKQLARLHAQISL